MKTLVIKAPVKAVHRGKVVGTFQSVSLVHKQGGSSLKLSDKFNIKLACASLAVIDDVDASPILEVSSNHHRALIPMRNTPEFHHFYQELRQAVDDGMKRSSGGGGFQPVNNLTRGLTPSFGGGGARRPLSMSGRMGGFPPAMSSGVVSRVPSGSGKQAHKPPPPPLPLPSPAEARPSRAMSPPRSSSSRFASASDALHDAFHSSLPSRARSSPPPPSPQRRPLVPTSQPRTTVPSSAPSDSVLYTPPKRRQPPASSSDRSAPPLPSPAGPRSLELESKRSGGSSLPVSSFAPSTTAAVPGIRKFTVPVAKSRFIGPAARSSATTASSSTTSSSSAASGGAMEGFPNLGNTCYLNAVLRCLLSLPSLTNDLLSSFWVSPIRHQLERAGPPSDATTLTSPPPASSKLMQLRVYASLLRLALLDRRMKHGVLDPSPFRQAMAAHYNAYGSSNQQDAHEFLGDVINTLQEELGPIARRGVGLALLEQSKASDGKKPAVPLPQLLAKAGLALLQPDDEEDSKAAGLPSASPAADKALSEAEASVLTQILPVSRNFHIEVAKTLTCESCGYSRSRVEAFTDFSLDLVEPHQHDSMSAALQPVLTIPDLLRGFFKRQVLELACEKCGHDKVGVEFSLDKLPNVLVIHLKRFRLDGTLNHKLTTRVKAPTTIDLRPFCNEFTHNPPRQGSLPQAVKEQDCAFLLSADKTPAPAPPPSSDNIQTEPPPAPAVGLSGTGLQSPPAPSKLVGLVENRNKRHLDVALRQSQDDDRWGGMDEGEAGDETEALVVTERKKRRSLTPSGRAAQEDGAARPESGGGSSSSVATALLMDSEGAGGGGGEVVDLVTGMDKEDDEGLQDAIQRSLQDQARLRGEEGEEARPSPMEIFQDDNDHHAPPAVAPVLLAPVSEDKENVCPNAAHAAQQQEQRSAQKPSSAAAPSASSPFNLSLLTPAAASRQHRTKRDEPLQSAYELKCVIRHIGRYAFSGHYIADVRTRESAGLGSAAGKGEVSWKRHDDSVVSKLCEDDSVLEEDKSLETGYIFFYTLNPQAKANRD